MEDPEAMMTAAEKWRDVAKRVRERLFALMPKVERNAVFELRRQDHVNAPIRSAELQIVPVTPSNVEEISTFRDDGIVKVFRGFLAEKEIGVYANFDGLAVGHAWAAVWHGSNRLVWDYLPVNSTTACIYFCSVSPSYRGRKIYQNMLVELAEIVFESTSVRRILISCAVSNLPSYSAIERVGFHRLLILPILRWRGRNIRFAKVPEGETDNMEVIR